MSTTHLSDGQGNLSVIIDVRLMTAIWGGSYSEAI